MTQGVVLWGTVEEHLADRNHMDVCVIRVVTNYLECAVVLREELAKMDPVAPVWVDERELQWWTCQDICWPSQRMVVAAGAPDRIEPVARWYADKLTVMGIMGIFGVDDGIFSHLNRAWTGDATYNGAANEFLRKGVRIASLVEDGPGGPRWSLEGSKVIPWTLRNSQHAPWYWARTTEYSSTNDNVPEAPQTSSTSDVIDAINYLRTQSIHLVDDPKRLPYPDSCRFVVRSSNNVIQVSVQRCFDSVQADQGSEVSIWLDELPVEPGPDGVVVAYQNPTIISSAPNDWVKIQVFDDHPVVWHAVRKKLLGRDGWFGRTPHRLDQPSLATHATHYSTEQPHPNPDLRWLECQPLQKTMENWITSEQQALDQMRSVIPVMERVIMNMADRYREGARIFYVGAGSAGRAGVMDAVELPPTFSINPDRVQAILAGGLGAFVKAKEGAEDSFLEGKMAIAAVATPQDVVVGITAHGDTPFVLGALAEAKNRGCYSIALVNNLGTRCAEVADEVLFVDSGPEILLGSTRLKAGTVEKVVLNMMSTLTMVKLGRSYDNLMIDFTATNDKLRERAVRVFMIATGESRNAAIAALKKSQGRLPVALVTHSCHVTEDVAAELLTSKTVSELLGVTREEKMIHGTRS